MASAGAAILAQDSLSGRRIRFQELETITEQIGRGIQRLFRWLAASELPAARDGLACLDHVAALWDYLETDQARGDLHPNRATGDRISAVAEILDTAADFLAALDNGVCIVDNDDNGEPHNHHLDDNLKHHCIGDNYIQCDDHHHNDDRNDNLKHHCIGDNYIHFDDHHHHDDRNDNLKHHSTSDNYIHFDDHHHHDDHHHNSCASCLDLFQNGSLADGVYTVKVRDLDDNVQDTDLFCDMTNGGWTLVGQIAVQIAINNDWLRAYHNESQLQARTITNNTWASIPAIDMAVNCASEVRLSNDDASKSVRWEMDADREISTWWNQSAGRGVINAAPGHQVLVHDQSGDNETCWQNRYGIMKQSSHGGSYPAATFNDQGTTLTDDLCLAVGVLPLGSTSNGFSQNGNGYDAPTDNTDWPNAELKGIPSLNVWLK
ncbi:unnamed protein product [Symbiodinium sp. KB8]|nr:unnamed protein product [Symbiodinium sp. KB8]